MNWSQSTEWASSNKNGIPKEDCMNVHIMGNTKNFAETNRTQLLASDPKQRRTRVD